MELETLVLASLIIGLVRKYLTLNKVWIRRTDRNVAESISIMALLLGFLTTLPFVLKYARAEEYQGVAKEVISIAAMTFMVLIGIGLWVPGGSRGFFGKLRDALHLERREAGEFVMTLLRPQGSRLILRILHQLALIDNHLDEREREYIEAFARAWGIPNPIDVAELVGGGIDGLGTAGGGARGKPRPSIAENLQALRKSVDEYLAISPPAEQVAQLRGVVDALVNIDDEVSREEQLIAAEVHGMLDHYVSGKGHTACVAVLVPQSQEQDAAIGALLPGATTAMRSGGRAWTVGRYYSEAYAEVICEPYRAMGLLALVLPDDAIDQPAPAAAGGPT